MERQAGSLAALCTYIYQTRRHSHCYSALASSRNFSQPFMMRIQDFVGSRLSELLAENVLENDAKPVGSATCLKSSHENTTIQHQLQLC